VESGFSHRLKRFIVFVLICHCKLAVLAQTDWTCGCGENYAHGESFMYFAPQEPRHMIALRTNLLHDLLYVPQFGFAPGANIQAEYYPLSGNYTFNAGFTFTNHRHWDEQKFMQIRDFQLSVRRYFKGEGEFVGPYVDGYAEFMKYGIGFGPDKGWQGEGGGAGVGAGYTWNLNKRGNLRLEVSLNLGLFVTRYDPYVWGDSNGGEGHGLYYYDYHGSISDFKERNHRFVWLGPTNAGVHITYDIIYRKQKREDCQ